MTIGTTQLLDKLNMSISRKINANTAQNLDINGVKNSVINGWRSLGTGQSIGYGGSEDREQYTVGNNSSSAPIVGQ